MDNPKFWTSTFMPKGTDRHPELTTCITVDLLNVSLILILQPYKTGKKRIPTLN